MNFTEIEQIVAERVANAIETIVIYETKTRMARESMTQTKQQKDKTAGPSNKKVYAGNLPLCNKYKFHHIGPCAAKCGNCKRFGHQIKDCRTSVLKAKQRPSVTKQKAEVTCYECGELGHYKNGCPILKFHNCVDMYWKGEAREDSSATTLNVNV
nr:hypothetical protein [Tanacetum cinerariifolium]